MLALATDADGFARSLFEPLSLQVVLWCHGRARRFSLAQHGASGLFHVRSGDGRYLSALENGRVVLCDWVSRRRRHPSRVSRPRDAARASPAPLSPREAAPLFRG